MSHTPFVLPAVPVGAVGFSIMLEVEVVAEGVRVVVQVYDPRDPMKRTHSAPFTLPTTTLQVEAAKKIDPRAL